MDAVFKARVTMRFLAECHDAKVEWTEPAMTPNTTGYVVFEVHQTVVGTCRSPIKSPACAESLGVLDGIVALLVWANWIQVRTK